MTELIWNSSGITDYSCLWNYRYSHKSRVLYLNVRLAEKSFGKRECNSLTFYHAVHLALSRKNKGEGKGDRIYSRILTETSDGSFITLSSMTDKHCPDTRIGFNLDPLPRSGRGDYRWVFSQAGREKEESFLAKWKGKRLPVKYFSNFRF